MRRRELGMDPFSARVTNAVERLSRSVVFLQAERAGQGYEDGLGTGFIWSETGYVATNAHTVEELDRVVVTLPNGRRHLAEVLGIDPLYDLALLKMEGADVTPAARADSDGAKPGLIVLALGNPHGTQCNVSLGVISLLDRALVTPEGVPLDGLLQTDAAINPGNSGGPLATLNGDVIGITTAMIVGPQGMGFAVPVNLAEAVFDQIIEHGRPLHLWLGLRGEEEVLDPRWVETFALPVDRGIVVTAVVEGGPAEAAGLEVFDMITHVEDEPLESMAALRGYVAAQRPGDVTKLRVLRGGKLIEVPVEVAEVPLSS